MDLLIKLGKYVFVEFISSWLDVVDTCRLDSACNRKQRMEYVHIMTDNYCVDSNFLCNDQSETSLSIWIRLRSYAVRQLDITVLSKINNHSTSTDYSSSPNSFTKVESAKLVGCDQASALLLEITARKAVCLCELYLHDCSLVNVHFCESVIAKHCTSLIKLSLSDCRNVNDQCVAAIAGSCLNLVEWDLSGCVKITDDSLQSIVQYNSQNNSSPIRLQRLNINRCILITDIGMSFVSSHCSAGLRELSMDSCVMVSDKVVRSVINQFCDTLTAIDLSHNSPWITNDTLDVIMTRCTSLTSLALCAFRQAVSNDNTFWFMHCPLLRTVNLDTCCSLKDSALYLLAGYCPLLTSFNMHVNDNITDTAVIQLAECCTGLTDINIGYCCNITDVALIAIASHCSALTSFSCSGNVNITAEGVVSLATKSARLSMLCLEHCDQLGDNAVCSAASHCRSRLVSLRLNDMHGITDKSLLALAQHCHRLRTLHLNNCFQITSDGVQNLTRGCTRLTDLDLSYNNLEATTFLVLAESCPEMSVLRVNYCSEVCNEVILCLAQHCPHICTLELQECRLVTSHSLSVLLDKCVALRRMMLNENTVGEEWVANMQHKFSHIEFDC